MKYLFIIALVLVVFYMWRHNRQSGSADAGTASRKKSVGTQAPTEIVACEVCHVHLPRSEALIGQQGGVYCSDAHRRQGAQ
jgi:uncharacterized protein